MKGIYLKQFPDCPPHFISDIYYAALFQLRFSTALGIGCDISGLLFGSVNKMT